MDEIKKKPYKFKKDEYIEQKKFIVATYGTGFNIKALQGLLNIINADHHIYMYYGSETHPPCREDVFWIVFARPRSISKGQFKFLRNQLVRSILKKNKRSTKKGLESFFGNKRAVQVRIIFKLSLTMMILEEKFGRINREFDKFYDKISFK